ncbi:MAG: hypothetical protein JWN44_3889 [Myxococcales bacterium]|nr:hypothetical protein [Myxococcales bacterium]
MWPAAVVAVVSAVAYLAMAPRVVNGDGLGYLKAALAGTIYPGHVAYVPLLALVARVTGATRPIALLWPARVLSAISVAVAVALIGSIARRRWAADAAASAAASAGATALAASIGLAASWGALSAGSDVESYAPALAALVAALWLADRQRPVAAGLACAAATLFHVENLLFIPVAALLLERRVRFAIAAVLPIALVYGALLPSHGLGWLAGASHGLHYPLRWTTPFVAIYGACKALVYSPYLYEASAARVVGCFAVGAAAAIALATGMRRPLPRAVMLAWFVPYALVGVLFWASDAERWTFLLPLVWLAAAARPRRAIAVATFVLAANLVAWLPVAKDDRVRARAKAAALQLRDGDVVIGPGHGWDEYLGFYSRLHITSVPLVYYAGAVGKEALPATIARACAGHRVWLARFTDDGDPMGWKELRLFGIDRVNARALLPPGHAIPVADGLERYDP